MLALFSGKTYVRIANAWDVTDLPGTGSTGDRRYTAHWDFNPAIIAALDPTPNADFLDVSSVDWFYYDVRYVCENGLMNGTSRNRFSPYGTATHRAVSSYALPAMRWACGTGILQGANGKLNPSGLATRAQLAAMLHRYLTK